MNKEIAIETRLRPSATIDQIQSRLEWAGAECIGSSLRSVCWLDTKKDHRLRRKGTTLQISQEEGEVVLSLEQKQDENRPAREISVAVSNYSETIDLLRTLGLSPVTRITTYTREWRLNDLVITLKSVINGGLFVITENEIGFDLFMRWLALSDFLPTETAVSARPAEKVS